MNVLPEGWSVLEGNPNPSILVDQEALRAAWVCIKGEKVRKRQAGQGSPTVYIPPDVRTTHANIRGALGVLPRGKDNAILDWVKTHQDLLMQIGANTSTARTTYYRIFLKGYKEGLEADYPQLKSPTPTRRPPKGKAKSQKNKE